MNFFSKDKDERIIFERNIINKNSLFLYTLIMIFIALFKILYIKQPFYTCIQEILLLITFAFILITFMFKKIPFKFIFKKATDEYLSYTVNNVLSFAFYISILSNFILIFIKYLFDYYNNIVLTFIPLTITLAFTLIKYIICGVIKASVKINNYTLRIALSSIIFALGMSFNNFRVNHTFSIKLFALYFISWGLPVFFIGKLIYCISDTNSEKKLK